MSIELSDIEKSELMRVPDRTGTNYSTMTRTNRNSLRIQIIVLLQCQENPPLPIQSLQAAPQWLNPRSG